MLPTNLLSIYIIYLPKKRLLNIGSTYNLHSDVVRYVKIYREKFGDNDIYVKVMTKELINKYGGEHSPEYAKQLLYKMMAACEGSGAQKITVNKIIKCFYFKDGIDSFADAIHDMKNITGIDMKDPGLPVNGQK